MRPERPSRRALAAVALLVLAAAVVAGCSVALQRPDVRVATVSLASLGFTGGEVDVVLEVTNPNRFALETRAFRYALSFAEGGAGADTVWARVVDGESRDTVRIPARDTASIPLRIPFDPAAVGAAVGRLLREGELGYRFNGALRLQTPVGGVDVPFDERGIFRP